MAHAGWKGGKYEGFWGQEKAGTVEPEGIHIPGRRFPGPGSNILTLLLKIEAQ